MFTAAGRIVMVVLGYLTAAAVSTWVVLQLGLERATLLLHDDAAPIHTVVSWVRYALSMQFVTPLLLSLLVVLAGEVSRTRSALFYIAGGGLAAAAVPVLAGMQHAGGLPLVVWQVCATAGFAGGAVYWLIAGRRA